MSPPMESMTSMPPAIISSTAAAISAGTDAGVLMRTMPASSGWPSASAAVSAPPIDRPGDDDLAVGHARLAAR